MPAKGQSRKAKLSRMFDHIEKYYEKKGLSPKAAKARAGATRNTLRSSVKAGKKKK